MKHFTPYYSPEDINPSEKTLKLIKQIAYTYKAIKMNGKNDVFCLS